MQVGLLMLGVCLLTMTVPSAAAQAASQGDTKATVTQAEQEIVTLSKDNVCRSCRVDRARRPQHSPRVSDWAAPLVGPLDRGAWL
jgi:hypothetical protein